MYMTFKPDIKFNSPKVAKKIFELRNKGEVYSNIALKIHEEFGFKITAPTVKNVYERYVGNNLGKVAGTEKRFANEIASEYQKKMEARFDKVVEITDDLMDTLVSLKKNIPPELYVKYIPTILMVCREILNQLNFIKKEQIQVLINQKNVIYSPMQIMNIVNQEILKLEKEGKIEIKNIAANGRILSDDEKNDEKKRITFSKRKTEEEIEMEQAEEKSDENSEADNEEVIAQAS